MNDMIGIDFELTEADIQLTPIEFMERLLVPSLNAALCAMRMKGVGTYDACHFKHGEDGVCSLEFFSQAEFIKARLAAAGIHKVAS
jgi:hypothetical protein